MRVRNSRHAVVRQRRSGSGQLSGLPLQRNSIRLEEHYHSMTKLWLFFGLSVCALGQVASVSAVDQISYSSWRMKLAVSGGDSDAARFYYSVAPLACTTVT